MDSKNDSAKKAFEYLTGLIDQGKSIVDSRTGGETEFSVNQSIQQAMKIFLDRETNRNPRLIEKSIEILENAAVWMRERKKVDGENDALWGLYLCYSRTRRPELAVKKLERLRDNMETVRANISNPRQRAGMIARYPYLYHALCNMLSIVGNDQQILDAIEGGKGRVLADLQTRIHNHPQPYEDFKEAVAMLPDLVRRVGVHYVSFLVDDDKSYGALVTKNGTVHTASIPLSKQTISELIKIRNPKVWGKLDPSDITSAPIPHDIQERLKPLLAWLEPFVQEGIILEGDHICYSPDHDMYCLPLHYVNFLDRTLIHFCSVSRVHGAHSLSKILEKESESPQLGLTIEVPAVQDQGNREKIEEFHAPCDWLHRKIKAHTLLGREADFETLVEQDLTRGVIHFATHGTFPERDQRGRDPNPYRSSGILLAARKNLPDLSQIMKGEGLDHIVSPRDLIDANVRFDGSHVTLQACVSGLAKEGIGGDALGLEWALFQMGAQSLLSTHWNVESSSSAVFTTRFYDLWLHEQKTRAESWRTAALELMEDSKVKGDSYHWAAFSLSGDWR